jgi:hypothetical protein
MVNFKRMVKMTVNPRSSIKSLRPVLASKFGCDFAHMRIRVSPVGCSHRMIDPDLPFDQDPYFYKPQGQLLALNV